MNPDCRACEGIEPLTPESVANRPGLPALHYRVGRHGSFLESMIARLSAQFEAPAAPGDDSGRIDAPYRPTGAYRLQTREPGDPSIALLDAWATVGDVLSFYQERIANEGYLRTAREERSLHELAGLVGYKLRPALSSSVHLAFDVQEPPALDSNVPPPKPHNVLIPKGTQVKSIPGSGELPQTFETSEELNARPEWNTLKPLTTQPTVITIEDEQTLAGSAYEITRLRFEGMSHNLHAGDLLLLLPPENSDSQAAPVVRQIAKSYLDEPRKQTVVDLSVPPFSYPKYRNTIIDGGLRFVTAVKEFESTDEPFGDLVSQWRRVAETPEQFFENVSFLSEADEKLWRSISDPKLTGQYRFQKAYSEYHQALQLLKQVNDRGAAPNNGEALTTELFRIPHQFASAHGSSLVDKGKQFSAFIEDYRTALKNHAAVLLAASPNRMTVRDDVIGDSTKPTSLDGVVAKHSSLSNSTLKTGLLDPFHQSVISACNDANSNLAQDIKKALWLLISTSPPPDSDVIAKFKESLERLKEYEEALAVVVRQQEQKLSSRPWNTVTAAETGLLDAFTWADSLTSGQTWPLTRSMPFTEKATSDLAKSWETARAGSVQPLVTRMQQIKSAIIGLRTWNQSETNWFNDHFPATDSFERLGKAILEMSKGLEGRPEVTPIPILVVLNRPGMPEADKAFNVLVSDWMDASQSIAKEIQETLHRDGPVSGPGSDIVQLLEQEIEQVRKDPLMLARNGVINALLRILDPEPILATLSPEDPVRALLKRTAARLEIKVQAAQSRTNVEVEDLSSIPDLGGRSIPATQSGLTSKDFAEIFKSQGGDLVTRLLERFGGRDQRRTLEAWSAPREEIKTGRVFRFRVRTGLFGARPPVVLDPEHPEHPFDPVLKKYEPDDLNILFLDNEYPDIGPETWCLIGTLAPNMNSENIALRAEDFRGFRIRAAAISQRSAHGQTGRTVRLQLQKAWRVAWNGDDDVRKQLRSTLVLAASAELHLAEDVIEIPFPDDKSNGRSYAETEDLKLADYQGDLETGRIIAISGEQIVPLKGVPEGQTTGTTATSVHRIVSASSRPDRTKSRVLTDLKITPKLRIRFKRETVRIYANVVEATHGEMFSEVLGDGEGQGAFQRFLLSQRGLTHLPAIAPSGMRPELSVRVNSVEWEFVDRIGDLQTERTSTLRISPNRASQDPPLKYLISFDDEQRTFITTGDGMTTGARLPTGIANVHARYRVGGGLSGNVKEGMITQMMAPPLNAAKVRNLLPATGGVDREGVDQARSNVPIAVQALDRIVSITDYASFARRFAGIAKAQATRLQTDRGAEVVLTIAGLNDVPIGKESMLFGNLQSSLDQFDDLEHTVRLVHRELVLLMLWARIKVSREYQFAEVEPRVRRRLLMAFDFEHSELGKDVLLSDAIDVIQNTPGVEYVDIDMFDSMRQFYGSGGLLEKAKSIAGVERTPVTGCQRDRPDLPQPLQAITVHSARSASDDDDYYFSNCVPGEISSLPDPRPAQLAYFADLPGTILLEEIR